MAWLNQAVAAAFKDAASTEAKAKSQLSRDFVEDANRVSPPLRGFPAGAGFFFNSFSRS